MSHGLRDDERWVTRSTIHGNKHTMRRRTSFVRGSSLHRQPPAARPSVPQAPPYGVQPHTGRGGPPTGAHMTAIHDAATRPPHDAPVSTTTVL